MSIENGYAICFNKWIFDKEIKSELGLLLLISSLCAEKGYCWANNEYFATLFQIDEVSVSRKIKKLEELNHIIINYEKRGCEIIKREIRLTKMLTDDIQNNQSTINKNVKDNNTITNNTIYNNKKYKKETTLSSKEILFEQFYKLYNNLDEIKESTKETKGYNKLKEKFIKETKTAKEEDVLQGTSDYLSFIAFEHKRGFNRPLKDIQTFINQSGWEGDKGIPWVDIMQKNLNQTKEAFINKINAPSAYEIKKQIKEQERWRIDDDLPF